MTAIEILRQEHRLIVKALDVLEATAARLAGGEDVPPALWDALLDWLRIFADVRHHAKEEEVLFPALIRAGAPELSGPVCVMLQQHDLGRALVAEMGQGEPTQRAAQARRYAVILREHLSKEDLALFPLAEELLDAPEAERVRREFERLDRDEHGRKWTLAAAATVLRGLTTALEASTATH